MSDIFAVYEKGLQHLLAHFGPSHERYIDLALLKSRFLMSTRNLYRYGENEPTEYAHFLRILAQLHQICAEMFHIDFDAWCDKCVEEEQNRQKEQQDPLQPYIGNWQALQDGKLQHFLKNELARRGLSLDTSRNIPTEDLLERYKKLPLHARILFTSQDSTILPYIKAHWDALDSLSRDLYDIQMSVEEFNGAEDGHDALETSYVVKKTGFRAYSLLPGILFWDKQGGWEFVSFGQYADNDRITWILRLISERLAVHPSIETVRQAHIVIRNKFGAATDKTAIRSRNNGVHLIEDDLEQWSDASLVIASGNTLQGTPAIAGNTSSSPLILTSENPVTSSELPSDLPAQLITELRNMPTGEGERYEELIKRVLEFCFTDEFHPLHLRAQVRTYNKKRRKDFIINNRNTGIAFWQNLKHKGVEQILFDAKNYRHFIEYAEITRTLRYLRNPAYGKFIIFVSRQGLKDFEEVLEDYQTDQQVALFLSDRDVISMINKKRSGGLASSIIEDRYYEFFDML